MEKTRVDCPNQCKSPTHFVDSPTARICQQLSVLREEGLMVRDGKLLCPYEEHKSLRHDLRSKGSRHCREQQIADGLNKNKNVLEELVNAKLYAAVLRKEESSTPSRLPPPRKVFTEPTKSKRVLSAREVILTQNYSDQQQKSFRESRAARQARADEENRRRGITFPSREITQVGVVIEPLPAGYSETLSPVDKLSLFSGLRPETIEVVGGLYQLYLSNSRGTFWMEIRTQRGTLWAVRMLSGPPHLSAIRLDDHALYLWFLKNILD